MIYLCLIALIVRISSKIDLDRFLVGEWNVSTSADAYSVTISQNTGTCYLKFRGELENLHEEEINKLQAVIEEQTSGIINYIFDLSDLNFINHKCYRPLAMAQHCARTKKNALVVINPPNALTKKLLLKEGLIRPREICSGLDKIGSFIKHTRSKLSA